ncbi:MAG TPA: glycerophosphodiester phosphodiesterase [Actinomycetota bacterium]
MLVRSLMVCMLACSTGVAPSSGAIVENPWLERRVLNMAHQGGEIEAPSDTMNAFKTAMAKGVDALEMDVHATADGEIVVLHDATVDRTTDGSGRVDALLLAQIQSLDAAHWFVPDVGTTHSADDEEYVFRGIAPGDVAPPEGFAPGDFTIPTLRQVLETFPDVPINIEIKNTAPDTLPYEHTLAALLAEFGRTDDVIVVSFLDHATELFKVHAPAVSTATGTVQAALFWASTQEVLPGAPNPRYQALQVPITFEGVTVVTEDFVADAHANGLAVHVWTINAREDMEWLIDIGVDGIMTDRPTLLEQVLIERGLA